MLRIMITDAHHRLAKYTQVVHRERNNCLSQLGCELLQQLEETIQFSVNSTARNRRVKLCDKFEIISRKPPSLNNDKWINNFSNRQLSETHKAVLVKGMKFNTRDATNRQFLASLEHSMKVTGLADEIQQNIRQTIIPSLTRKYTHTNLSHEEIRSLKSLKGDRNIIILPADKGRSTVIMNRTDYMDKARSLLADTTTYREQNNDPTNKLINEINKTLKTLQDLGEITKAERWTMKAEGTSLAQFYGLPKVHKEGTPLGPIVSLPGTPTYKLAKYLWRRLHPLTMNSQHSIDNAKQFLEKLSNIHLDVDDMMVSFDVTALFTSIDLHLAMDVTKELVERGAHRMGNLSNASLYRLLGLCLKTNFEFAGKIYPQVRGTPMGSPISGFIAEAAMQKVGFIALPSFEHKLWVRYVDDVFAVVKKDNLGSIHQTLNNIFKGIQFTIKKENHGTLSFLDVAVHRTSTGNIETSVYRKKTHTDQILLYDSKHPKSHKESCIQTLFNRVKTHCSIDVLKCQERKHLLHVFSSNGYPKNFVYRTIRRRNNISSQSIMTSSQPRQRRTRLPYCRRYI